MGNLLLKSETLLTAYEELDLFAKENQNRGAIKAINLIKEKVAEDKDLPRDGSKSMYEYYKGYDNAIKWVLNILESEFKR